MDLGLKKKKLLEQVQTDIIEDTFGPNPCTSLHLHNDETNETLKLPCNGKRCIHCGPRKKATIQHQMKQGFGEYAYITTYSDRIELDRAIERIRKADSRANRTPVIQSVGDATLGWILVSNRPTYDTQRLTTLADWYRRILDLYHHSVQRIRRSYALGRLSLVRNRRSTNSGQASPWYRRSINSDVVTEMQDLTWGDMLAETEWKEDVLLIYRPDVSLPIPF